MWSTLLDYIEVASGLPVVVVAMASHKTEKLVPELSMHHLRQQQAITYPGWMDGFILIVIHTYIAEDELAGRYLREAVAANEG